MPQRTKVFISYRNIEYSKDKARQIAEYLRNSGNYEIFWDFTNIRPGDEWKRTILENLYGSELDAMVGISDVVVVLLEKETMNSVWVQREIDVARGAHISILPVKISSDVTSNDLAKFGLDELQYLVFDASASGWETLLRNIDLRANETYHAHRSLVRKLNRKRMDAQIARSKRKHTSFKLRNHADVEDCPQIHLTTGDIISHTNIDVIVNTENNYMQMARVHEKHTVSSRLRYSGALFSASGINLLEDTVQLELDAQIDQLEGRPLRLGNVIVTNAGHHQSDLRAKGIRYIFHAATVGVEYADQERHMSPMRDMTAIRNCVINCLNKVAVVNRNKGVVSQPGWRHHAVETNARDDYRELESIIFPLLGVGEAESRPQPVVEAMIDGIETFLEANPDTTLRHIHICAYRDRDVAVVLHELRQRLFELGR